MGGAPEQRRDSARDGGLTTAAWPSGEPINGQVRVTYNGGFAVVPAQVQLAVVEIVKAALARLKIEDYLKDETGGEYSYTLDLELLAHLPKAAVTSLANYRVHNA